MNEKRCSKCLIVKPINLFPKCKGGKFGVRGNCRECEKIRQKEYRDANKDKKKELWASWFERNTEYNKSRWKDYYYKNAEKQRDRVSRYKKNNPYKYLAYNAKRRSSKLQATPNWLSEVQLQSIEHFYWLAKDLFSVTGEVYHVDHIVPLQGEHVCGLHVPWNLQVLPSDINIKKGNSFAAETEAKDPED